MRLRGPAEYGAVIALGLALTAVLTYPLLFQIDRIGRVNTDDGMFGIWAVAWVAHALTTNPAQLYDANIFYPHIGTLAFSEPNIVAGALGAPIWALTHNPFLTYNVAAVLSFLISFTGAYALTRYLTGSRGAAAITAVMFAFCPFVFARTAEIQLLMVGGLPFCMLAFHRLVDRPTVSRSVALGVLMALQALACGYYGIFAALMVGSGVLLLMTTRRLWRSLDHWLGIGLAAFVSIALTLPFFVPYAALHRDEGFGRTLLDSLRFSANGGAWLASSAWAHRWWLPAITPFNEVLFPGIAATLLGLAGIWRGLRRNGETDRPEAPPRDVIWLYLGLGVIAFWASFGPRLGLYTALFETIPVFSFMRAPARMGIITTLSLVVLAGIALASWPRVSGRVRPAALLLLLVAAELMPAPLLVFRNAPPVERAYRELAKLPRGPVAEFPYFFEKLSWSRHAYFMLKSTAHWQPLVNGYSDYIPDTFRQTARTLSTFPSRRAFEVLRGVDTRYVVFHLGMYDNRSRELLLERLHTYEAYLRPLVQEDGVWLFEISGWPAN